MKRQIQKIGLVTSLIAAAFSASLGARAESLPFKSADFDFEGSELLQHVNENQVSANGDVLYCRADIGVQGEVEQGSCFAKGAAVELVIDTEKALKRLAFTAAEVEGKAVPVRMSFRIAYTPLSASTHVSLIPNLGTMQARLGRDYVAPQERLDVSDWYANYSESSYLGGSEFLGNGDIARVATKVTASGKATAFQTIDAKKAHRRDAELVKQSLRKARFIPGHRAGKVLPMQYVAAVHYEDASDTYATAD